MNSKDLKYWIAFSKCDFDSRFTVSAYKHFGSIKEAWHASCAEISEIENLTLKKINTMNERKRKVNPDEAIDEILSRDLDVITYEDERYPELLKQIDNPPASFFIKGDFDSCNLNKALAVVGSRKASHYIIEILAKLVKDLPSKDITIISGLALGTDACAHKAAIESNLKTIAVLGGGFDKIYPAANKKLFEQIIDGNGAVISEYYPTVEPMAWQFPHRNRIVSGLSQGTLVGEAAIKSGALITAELALEHNRELMCVPGLITNPNTEGPHELIKSGANLVTKASDIMNCLKWEPELVSQEREVEIKTKLLDNEQEVYKILNLEPMAIDTIIQKTSLDTANLMVILTSLELQGIIKQLPGEKFIRTL